MKELFCIKRTTIIFLRIDGLAKKHLEIQDAYFIKSIQIQSKLLN